MAFLYISPTGVAWTKHSYSAGIDFDHCAMKYALRRIHGWKMRENKASLVFGRAVESAVEYYHNNGGTRLLETFDAQWSVIKDDANIKYTKLEKDWENLNKCGQDMLKLYLIRQSELPIPMGAHSIFQREYGKEVYPGDPNYGGITDNGKIDIISYVKPDHPMLASILWKKEYGPLRPVIIDMKTGAKDFHLIKGMAGYDPQLRRYSWLSGIRDVAFLWFKKAGQNLKKGSKVTTLVEVAGYPAGSQMIVAHLDEQIRIVPSEGHMLAMDEAQGRKPDGKLDTTKLAQERKQKWLGENALVVQREQITRVGLQFNSARLTDQEAEVAGRIAGRQIQGIVNAWRSDVWDNTFQVRYPHDDSSDPYFRAFVLNDLEYRKENFIKTDESSLDELFADETEEIDADEE